LMFTGFGNALTVLKKYLNFFESAFQTNTNAL